MSTKPLTISLQSLNNLYCKYLDQYILQHLPKNIVSDVNILLGTKSAIQAYKYLDNKLNNTDVDDIKDRHQVSSINERKSSSHSKNSNHLVGNDLTKKGNINSSIDRRPFMEDDREKQKTKRMNSLLKRANTYAQQRLDNINDSKFESFNKVTLKEQNRQKQNHQQLNHQDSIKRVHSHTNSTSHIPITSIPSFQQQQQSSSENRYYQSPQYKRQNTKKRQEDRNYNNSLGLRSNKVQGQGNFHKEKQNVSNTNNHNTSSQNGGSMNKIQFAKTYSTRQVITNDNTHYSYLSKHNNTTTTINRNKLLSLVKKTRQIFADNAKKILRYENLSSDLAAIQQQHNHNNYLLGKTQKASDELYKLTTTTNNNSYSNSSNYNRYNNIGNGKKY